MAMYPCLSLPPLTFPTLTDSIVTFNSQYAGLPLKSHSVEVVATQSGSGTPSPQNIRSINGVSSFSIFNSDYNLIDADAYYGQYKSGDAYITTGTNFTSIRIPIGAFVGKQITFSAYIKPSSGITNVRVRTWIENNNAYTNGNAISGGSEGYSSVTITPSSIFDFLNISYGSGGGNTVEVSNVQLEYGDTRTSYHAFEGQSFTIQIGSTVYGGEYDARTGVFTVTDKIINLGNLSWSASGSNFVSPYFNLTDTNIKPPATDNDVLNGMCEVLNLTSYNSLSDRCIALSSDKNLFARNSDYIDANDFKNSVTGYNLKYPLATLTTIQLLPCLIDTLLGENNIWANTGDTTLQYPEFG